MYAEQINGVPDEIEGVILLSVAYYSKAGNAVARLSPYQKARILTCAIFRPSHQVVEYHSNDRLGLYDPLFTYKYTYRFLTLLNVKQLHLPAAMHVPLLAGVGVHTTIYRNYWSIYRFFVLILILLEKFVTG